MAAILILENFDCTGDPTSVGVCREKWKRAVEIFLLASNITDLPKQKATLITTLWRINATRNIL